MRSDVSGDDNPPSSHSPGEFPNTAWSMIAGAQGGGDASALAALERLAKAYWKPLYVFARQRGLDHHAAADSVQGLFARICSRDVFQGVVPAETRFRSFLLRVFCNFLEDERRHGAAKKRGGGFADLPLSSEDSSLDFSVPPALVEEETPEHAFDRAWARAIFDRAAARLDEELAGDRVKLEIRRRMLEATPAWDALSAETGEPHANIRQTALRLRQRLVGYVKAEVRGLVGTEEEFHDEMRHILTELAR